MLRAMLVVVTLGVATGLTNAQAQSSVNCGDWCRINRCSGGMTAGAAPQCMTECVAVCQQKMSKT